MKIHEYNEMMSYLTRPGRTGFKHGGTWKEYMLRGEKYKDLSFEEWLREDKAQGGVIGKGGMFQGQDMGYRTGFARPTKWTPDKYTQLYDEYVNIIDTAFEKENLMDVPQWETFVKNKTGQVSEFIKNAASKVPDKPWPSKLLQNTKLKLAEKLIDAENLKFDGVFWRVKAKGGKGSAASLFQGKIIPENETFNTKAGLGKKLRDLTISKLDTREDKVKKVFNYITNPDYELKTNSFRHEIATLMNESDSLFDPKNKEMNKLWKEISKDYQYKDAKGNIKNSLDDLGYKLRWLAPGSDRSVGYLLEIAENDKLGKAGFSDWEQIAGKKPEQWAMQQVQKAWANNDPRVKFYDMNEKPITWEAGKKLKSTEILFSYTDEKLRGFDNKLYGFRKPGKDLPIWKNTNKQIIGLEGSIRNLDEFKELVEVVDGKNKLNDTKMFNPFRNKETTYKTYFEDIYKQVGVATRKGYYTRSRAMSAHIDHEFGQAKSLFNNLRLATGPQNQMFKNFALAAEKMDELKPYVQALEMEIYAEGSIDNQIKNLVNEANELGKIVASSPGKVTLPTASHIAANKFLSNKIPGIPKEVVEYLTPLSKKAEDVYVNNPLIKQWANALGITAQEVENAVREAGIKATDNKNVIYNKVKNAPIPNRFKTPALALIAGTAAITGADLMTGSVEAAEPGQMPQGSPGQLSEDQGLSLQDKAAIGTVAVAGAKPAFQAAKAVGKGALKTIASPTSSALFSASNVFESINPFNEKFGKVKEDPNLTLAGIDLMIPDLVKRAGGKFATVQNVWSQIKNLGIPMKYAPFIIKRMTGLGIALTGADVALGAKKFADQLDFDRPLTEEQRTDIQERKTAVPRMFDTYEQASKIAKEQGISYEDALKQLDTPNIPGINFNQGGRVGFDEGSKPKSPSRRAFLKGVTALAALPIVGRFFKLADVAKQASTYMGPTIDKVKGMPEWFPGLVKKLFNEGEDVTKQAAFKDRQVVKRGTLEGGDDVDMIYDLETGNVSINVTPKKGTYETSSGAYNKEYSLEYTKGQADEMTKGKKPSDEFEVAELEGRADPNAMDIDWEGKMTTVDDAMSDLTELEAFAKNKTTTQIHKKKGTKPKDVFPDYDYDPRDDY